MLNPEMYCDSSSRPIFAAFLPPNLVGSQVASIRMLVLLPVATLTFLAVASPIIDPLLSICILK